MGIDGNNVVYSFTAVVIGYGGGTRLGKREESTGSRGIDACAPLSRTLYCNGRCSHTGGIAEMGNGFRVQFQIEVSAFQLYHVYGRFQIAEREFDDSAAPAFTLSSAVADMVSVLPFRVADRPLSSTFLLTDNVPSPKVNMPKS